MNKTLENKKNNSNEEKIRKACAAAFQQGYAMGYKNGKSRAIHKEFKASVKGSNEPAKIDKNKKWHGKKSKSWMWV